MEKYLSPILLALVLGTAGCTRPESLDADHSETLLGARAALAEAILHQDLEALELLYADEYMLTNRRASNRTKEDRLRMLGSGELQYLDLGEEAEVATAFFGNVAVVRGHVSSATTVRGGDTLQTGPKRFMAVWVHNGDRWQQVARQHTSVVTGDPHPSEGG